VPNAQYLSFSGDLAGDLVGSFGTKLKAPALWQPRVHMRSIQRSVHLYDQAYDILWEKILVGEIRPGQRLRDIELAEQMKISRTPAREAMRKLEQDGILKSLEHGGYEVTEVRAADLRDLYRCRIVLEGLAARDAVDNFTPDDERKLEQLIARTEDYIKRGKFEQALKCNTEFHVTICELSKNAHLIRLLESLWRLIIFHRSALMKTALSRTVSRYAEHLEKTQREHRAILVAMSSRDPEQAGPLMERHLSNTAADMDEMLREMESTAA
jgi:DNA-binding GntR family transcriptional regulator